MPQEYAVMKFKYAGEKPNPHGGVLHKFYVSLDEGPDGEAIHDVYWQRKSRELEVAQKVYGHIEDGEYGKRFKTDQRDGNFQSPSYEREAGPRGASSAVKSPADPPQGSRTGGFQEERSRRIERQHSQEMAIRAMAFESAVKPPTITGLRAAIKDWTDHFQQDLDVEFGSGQAAHGASEQRPPVDGDAADLSAETPNPGLLSRVAEHEEATPAQKGKLTQLFGKAGLSREAMKAVVMFRCGQEKATKQGASQLITDLQDGATHDALLAEIYDAHRAGNPLGTRAAALIPSETPADTEGLPELDPEDRAKYGAPL